MGAESSSVRIVNYSAFHVIALNMDRKHPVYTGTSHQYFFPCSVLLESGLKLSLLEGDKATEVVSHSQKVITRANERNLEVLIFNADGGFSPKIDRDLLQYIRLSGVHNFTHQKRGGYIGIVDARSCSKSVGTLDRMLPFDGAVKVKSGKLCAKGAILDIFFSEDDCFCCIKDESETRYKLIRNHSSRPVEVGSDGMFTVNRPAPPATIFTSIKLPYLFDDLVKIDGEFFPFPVSGERFVKGFILSSKEWDDDDRYRVGEIHDDPRWCLALSNNSSSKLTVTLKSGKQKVVNTGVFVEYRDVAEIKTPDGSALGYLTAVGEMRCGACLFNVTQKDSVTARIDVCDVVGG